MTEDERWDYLCRLDEELLQGGVILTEWCSFIVREADVAFAKGAHLASILTAISGIETYLRSEYGGHKRATLHNLVEESPIERGLKNDIHMLRSYRNKWVHVSDPSDDKEILENPAKYEHELEVMAIAATRVLRRTIYENQCL